MSVCVWRESLRLKQRLIIEYILFGTPVIIRCHWNTLSIPGDDDHSYKVTYGSRNIISLQWVTKKKGFKWNEAGDGCIPNMLNKVITSRFLCLFSLHLLNVFLFNRHIWFCVQKFNFNFLFALKQPTNQLYTKLIVILRWNQATDPTTGLAAEENETESVLELAKIEREILIYFSSMQHWAKETFPSVSQQIVD